jgi:hypothetical protein
MVKAFQRVTHQTGNTLYCILRTYHHDTVTYLKSQVS